MRGRKDSAEAKDTSPCPKQTESTACTENESCLSKDQKKIKKSRVKQTNSSLELSELSEESNNSYSPRESDSPGCVEISDQLSEQIKPSTFKETEATSLEGSLQNDEAPLQNDEAVLSEFEVGHSPLSSIEEQVHLKEDDADSEVRFMFVNKVLPASWLQVFLKEKTEVELSMFMIYFPEKEF